MTFGCLRSRGCLRSAAPLGAAAQGLAGRGHAGHHAGHGAQRPPQQGLAPGQPWGPDGVHGDQRQKWRIGDVPSGYVKIATENGHLYRIDS